MPVNALVCKTYRDLRAFPMQESYQPVETPECADFDVGKRMIRPNRFPYGKPGVSGGTSSTTDCRERGKRECAHSFGSNRSETGCRSWFGNIQYDKAR